jgi:SAM-dependent methyltransferase
MPPKPGEMPTDPKEIVRAFYADFGWSTSRSGELNDTALFVDTSAVPRRYTARCNEQVNRFLPPRGRFLLDVGSGPITHDEYLKYHENFSRRVCVDFSLPALRQAQRKIGDRGIYIVGDITNLPLAAESVEAAVCCHVVYHVPAEQQQTAFEEIARVVARNGRAVVVYRWQDSPLSWRLEKLMKLISVVNPAEAPPARQRCKRRHRLSTSIRTR